MNKNQFLYVILTMMFTLNIFAAGPGTITYQGTAVLPSGKAPADGNYDMKLSLWDLESGGSDAVNKKWEETCSSASAIAISSGAFSVLLGKNTYFPSDFFKDNPNLWLQVQVDLNKNGFEAGEVFTPRTSFTAAPYAYHSETSARAETANSATTAENALHASDVSRIVNKFIVASGESITAGDVVSFINGKIRKGCNMIATGNTQVLNSAGTVDIAAAKLTDTKFVVAYRCGEHSNQGTAIVVTISGSNVDYSTDEYIFNAAQTQDICVAALSDTKFVVAYADAGGSYFGTALIGTLSGSTITFGAKSEFNTGATNDIALAALSSNKIVVAYTDTASSSAGTCCYGTVVSTDIYFNIEYVFNSAIPYYTSISALDSARFVVAYRDSGDSYFSKAVIGTVGVGIITYGSACIFNTADTFSISTSALSGDKFVVAYRDGGSSNAGTAVIGTVTGSTINFGADYIFNGTINSGITTAALSDSAFAIFYKFGATDVGASIVGRVTNTMISFCPQQDLTGSMASELSVAAMSESKFAALYTDGLTSNYCTAIIGDFYEPFGIADTMASGGSNLTVILQGISNHHSSLSPGISYYGNYDGSLTKTPNAFRIGRAVSTTELLLELGR